MRKGMHVKALNVLTLIALASAWLVAGMARGGPVEEPPHAGSEGTAVAELEALLGSRATPEALAELIRWTMRYNDAFLVEYTSDPEPRWTYSHPVLERLQQNASSLPWARGAALLSPEDCYRLFCMQEQADSRYRPVDFVSTLSLLRDEMLLHVMTYLVEHADEARYDGIEGTILYPDRRLAKAPEFIWRFVKGNPGGFARTVEGIRNQPLYQRLLTDTFNELPATQVEPCDHLYARLRLEVSEALAHLDREPYMTRAALNRFCRQYTNQIFGNTSDRESAPPVAFGHNGDMETRTFDFLCAGEIDRVQLGETASSLSGIRWLRGEGRDRPVHSRSVERIRRFPVFGFHIVYGTFDLRPGVDKSGVELFLRAATGVYAISFEVEEGEGSLPAPSERLRLDQAKALGEMNVVSSFALFSEPAGAPSSIALVRLAEIGLVPVGPPVVVPDLWLDFQLEVARPNTSLVVPIYHVVDHERFRLGWNNARKMVFTKTVTDEDAPGVIRRIRAVLYVPPAEPGAEEVLLHRSEFGKLFRTRAVSPVQEDTLSLINMSCFSQYTVESWMAAFREAVRDRNPAEVAPEDIPFLVGSRRGFDANDPFSLLLSPDLMMRGICADRTRAELLMELTELGHFAPLTNLDRPELLRMGGSFQLHVVRAGRPEESASF